MDTKNENINPEAIPKDALYISIKSPEKTMFEGIIKGVSSVNDKGPFDILSEHENFISIIREKLTVYPLEGKKMEWGIDSGVLKVRENKVNVFLGIETT